MVKMLILLAALALSCQLVKGQINPPPPVGTVTCNDDHTVDINIANVDDRDEWLQADWNINNDGSCGPSTFSGTTVAYTNLNLPDCALSSEQLSDSIKYVLKIEVEKPDPMGTGQLRAYNHLYYVSCTYDNQNRTSASFVPIVNRNDNDSSNAFFTFELQGFPNADFTGVVPNPVALDITLHFRARVVTQSSASNLDLFPVECWSSQSSDPDNTDGRFILIENGCGNNTVHQDVDDTFFYNCTDNDIQEEFSINTYRYFGQPEGSTVYIHCEFRVCLANAVDSLCECPSVAECDPANRKKRSIVGIVDETKVYRVSSGPFTFENTEDEEEVDKEEGKSDEKDETQSSQTNVVMIVAICGVVAVAIVCATVYLIVRSRNKKRQNSGDLNVAT